jgi:hypothetical protein
MAMTNYSTKDNAAKIVKRGDLEKLVDVYDLATVIEALGMICREKSAHVLENWQNATKYARSWDRDAQQLEKLVSRMWN